MTLTNDIILMRTKQTRGNNTQTCAHKLQLYIDTEKQKFPYLLQLTLFNFEQISMTKT